MSTYQPIASVTLSSAQSSVTFSGIPQTYTDLILVVNNIVSSGTGNDTALRFNDDTSSNYSNTYLLGTGTSALSGRNPLTYADNGYLSANSGNPNTRIIHLMNYTNTTTFKTQLTRASGQNGGQVTAYVNLWRSTSAITKILVYSADSLNYAAGSTFNLYGVANASITNVAKATGGDSVTTDGTYWYHTFRSSGTFTPTQALTADYLVVAGGGGAGGWQSGGGGAGGLRCTVTATGGGGSLESALSLTAQAYTVTVGAGGAGGVYPGANQGNNGSNSVFSTITSTGGGGGGTYGNPSTSIADGKSGGSGGGAGGRESGDSTGGAGTSNQGYAGGTTFNAYARSALGGWVTAGGGGAGAVGGNNGSFTSGNGGNGVATSISGSSVTYAGGGGGNAGGSGGFSNVSSGTGGTGGGGNGGRSNSQTIAPQNGTANLGG